MTGCFCQPASRTTLAERFLAAAVVTTTDFRHLGLKSYILLFLFNNHLLKIFVVFSQLDNHFFFIPVFVLDFLVQDL